MILLHCALHITLQTAEGFLHSLLDLFSFSCGCYAVDSGHQLFVRIIQREEKYVEMIFFSFFRRPPSLLEFFSYNFCFHNLMCGPFCFYNDYISFIEGTNYLPRTSSQVCHLVMLPHLFGGRGGVLAVWSKGSGFKFGSPATLDKLSMRKATGNHSAHSWVSCVKVKIKIKYK